MQKRILLIIVAIGCICATYARQYMSNILVLPDEKWWGGLVAQGARMPYLESGGMLDLSRQGFNNQFLESCG